MATTTKLIFTLPDGSADKYSLSREGEYTLGTAKSCDITLDDDTLDGEHAKLVADETNDTRWFLQTLSTKAITVIENDTEHQLGNTQIDVHIYEEEDDDAEVEVEPLENDRQLEELTRAHEIRELKGSIILIVICAILSFAAGVAWRLLS